MRKKLVNNSHLYNNKRIMVEEIKEIIDLPEGFKMTELGPLPEDWKVVKLGEVITYQKGRKPEKLSEEPLSGSLPYLTAEYFRTGQAKLFISEGDNNKNIICEPSDIVLIWDGSNAGDVFTGLRGILASTMVRIRSNASKLDHVFAYFYLKTKSDELNNKTTGSAVPHINRSIFESLPIPLPPLPEQRKIAYVLYTVQKAKEATEKVIQATRELKKSLMHYLFTYGPAPLNEADRIPLKETEIGTIPEYWQVVQLGEVFDVQQGKSLSRKKNLGVRPRPFLRTSNIHWGSIDFSTLDEMDFDEDEEHKYALHPGDLLVCEGGEIGRTALWEGQLSNIYYQNHIHRLRPKIDNVEPRFIMYWMQAAFTLLGLYKGFSNKTTIPNLSRGRLSQLFIPLPPLLEQHKIAKILQVVDRKIEAEIKYKQALESLFKTLLQQLMTGQIRLKDFVEGIENGSITFSI